MKEYLTYSYDELWGMMECINKECNVFQDKILITDELVNGAGLFTK